MYRRAFLSLLVSSGVATSQTTAQLAAPRESTVVVLLGTGMPRPDPEASGPATAIVVGERVYLVDAGPGVERRLAAAHLPIDGVTALFVTHLHSDHTLGLPDLIFTSWVMGRTKPLAAYGPHGLRAMTDHILAAWPAYMRDFHTSDVELGQLAARIRPKLLILSHIIRRGATDEELLAGVRQSFDGRVVVGHDLERY